MRITLCAASLTAAAALFTTLPTAAAAPSQESTDFTPEQQTLLSHLPRTYDAGDCKPGKRLENAAYIASIICRNSAAGSPSAVGYYLYPTADAMNSSFDRILADDVRPAKCGTIDNGAEWVRKSDPDTALGRVGCGKYKGNPEVVWTNNETLILGSAGGRTNIDAVMKWWKKNAI